jgi:hypothetical protein
MYQAVVSDLTGEVDQTWMHVKLRNHLPHRKQTTTTSLQHGTGSLGGWKRGECLIQKAHVLDTPPPPTQVAKTRKRTPSNCYKTQPSDRKSGRGRGRRYPESANGRIKKWESMQDQGTPDDTDDHGHKQATMHSAMGYRSTSTIDYQLECPESWL